MWREGGGNDGLLPGLQLASFDPVLSRVRVSRDPNVIPAAGTKNTLVPEPQAVGPHSTFQRAPDGSIHNYETYEQNPTTGKLDRKLRYRGTGKPHSALLYSTIFFPEFIEVDGSILLKNNVPDVETRFRSGGAESNLSLAESEASFNSVEVGYIFSTRPISSFDTDTSALEQKLAKIIADAWRCRLKDLYPSRIFSVSVLTPEQSGSVYSVEFYELR
jgi:hypothetical protein